MLAFIRGDNSFMGSGEIYVQLLPSGEPVQLTHDGKLKMAPAFSPDNASIVYSFVGPWDTWEVGVLGGDPHLLLPNSSSLSWIDQGKRLLFSEMRDGMHLVLVTTDEARGDRRDVYLPPGQRSMVHHSYLFPRWPIGPRRPHGQSRQYDPVPGGSFRRRRHRANVGPPDRQCMPVPGPPTASGSISMSSPMASTSGASTFPWAPEQVTFGPTTQEGIAMAADGKSLVTSVGTQASTVWMHDSTGDHQISSEGYATAPQFSADGRALYFLMANEEATGQELWSKDLATDKLDSVLPGYAMETMPCRRTEKSSPSS